MGFWDVAADFFKNLFSFDQAHPLLFTQFYFWAFFAIVLAFLCVFKNKVVLRNAFLFFVSLFFYYKTSGLFLILFGFVIVYNYLAGFALSGVKGNFGRKAIAENGKTSPLPPSKAVLKDRRSFLNCRVKVPACT